MLKENRTIVFMVDTSVYTGMLVPEFQYYLTGKGEGSTYEVGSPEIKKWLDDHLVNYNGDYTYSNMFASPRWAADEHGIVNHLDLDPTNIQYPVFWSMGIYLDERPPTNVEHYLISKTLKFPEVVKDMKGLIFSSTKKFEIEGLRWVEVVEVYNLLEKIRFGVKYDCSG